LWWSIHGRNKKSITLDLKKPRARELVLALVASCDAVVENFRPGQMTKLGLDEQSLRRARADLVIAHISGYGQDGPYRERPAFGVIGEAMGGLRYLTNHPPGQSSLPPVRVGVSIGDSVAGLYCAFGVMAALWRRATAEGSDSRGRSLDVALTESVLSMMEGMLPEYGTLGKIKQPTGGAIATAAPSNVYPTCNGKWVLIAANSDPLFEALTQLMGQPELAASPKYCSNRVRVENAPLLDALIGQWSAQFTEPQLLSLLTARRIPNATAYTAADCAADVQYRFRRMVREVEDPILGKMLHSGIVPHFPDMPGEVRWPGPQVGQHTSEVLQGLLGLSGEEIEILRREAVI
jgi:crotonobetainyl-CoA:carnitine CoA-transferase CaiB-like acyl-CoA transferase